MKTFFVGIDISKDWLDVALVDGASMCVIDAFREDNTIEGIGKILRKCARKSQDNKLWFCFEHTGNYGLLLAQLLENGGFAYSAVPALEIKQSIGMTRGKNDRVDAERIAFYAAANAYKLKETKLPGKQLLRVKHLLTHRSQLVKISQQLQNSRKSTIIAGKSVDLKDLIESLEVKICEIKAEINLIEEKIKAEIAADDKLQENFKKITTVKGVGLMIAATMIVCTNNFTAFEDPRKFNCFAGLAPFSYSSGSSIQGKTRTSSLRNKNMKKLLFNGANTAVMYDHELSNYYKRKKSEGKHHMVVINAVACKIVYRIFAVLKREEPYVNLTR